MKIVIFWQYGGQIWKSSYNNNMHINSYVFRAADHENEVRFNKNGIWGCIEYMAELRHWPLEVKYENHHIMTICISIPMILGSLKIFFKQNVGSLIYMVHINSFVTHILLSFCMLFSWNQRYGCYGNPYGQSESSIACINLRLSWGQTR